MLHATLINLIYNYVVSSSCISVKVGKELLSHFLRRTAMRKRFGGSLWKVFLAGLLFGVMTPNAAFCRESTAPKEPVPAPKLLPFVTLQLVGWDASGKPTATTVKRQNIPMSEARAYYQAIYKRLEIIVLDYRGQTMPWLKQLPPKEIKTPAEVKRAATIEGFKTLEIYKPETEDGELNINVADRFWVKVRGEGIENTEPLKIVAREMNLKKLAALATGSEEKETPEKKVKGQ
jgi:hypothetical protein